MRKSRGKQVERSKCRAWSRMGIAEFQCLEKLPEELKGSLPTVDEIEAELGASDHSETS